MHYIYPKKIINNYGMNIYRGCSHGCIYCDSRSKCYSMDHKFTDIAVKINADKMLVEELSKMKKKTMIGTGSMGDPYCHIEKDLKLTRRCLEVLYKFGFGVNIQTKSTLLLRDLDLLKKINERTKVIVNVTLTTYDEDLCKILEPNVSTTKERFEMLKTLNENGIETIVWAGPILPFINDTKENIEGILSYCIKAKVKGVLFFGAGLTLREGNREYYYENLDKYFPGLKEKYIKRYGNIYEVNSPYNNYLSKIVYDTCKKNNIECDINKLFTYMHKMDDKIIQYSLF